ncbi:MAG: AMP-binding protein, partial [Candidatus Jordarchaeaceae archaeon]
MSDKKGSKGKDELPDYIKKRIWLKSYPKDVPKEVKIPTNKAIPDLLDEAVARNPEFVVMKFYGKEIKRKDLKDRVDRLCTAFQQKLGIKKGDKIAIYLPNCPDFQVAYFAGLKAGATLTCISPLFVPREVAYQIKDSGAETIVTMDLFYPRITADEVKNDIKLKNIVLMNIFGNPPNVPESKEKGIYHLENLIKETPPKVQKVKIDPMKD